jgi:endonuclease/exonuclease/phosphatase family metal-dependent hydrolase
MSRPSYPWAWQLLAVSACLAIAAALLTASSSAGTDTHKSLRMLQMNLCDSGIARCYTGRSVAAAANVIRADAPDVVTLDEVCQDDVYVLDKAMVEVDRGSTIVPMFKAAENLHTPDAFRCLNGQPYGIGLIVRVPTANLGYSVYDGIYQAQDVNDTEKRAWLCVDVISHFLVCATHLSNTSATVALAQCHYLLDKAIPAALPQLQPTVVGGDFNLRNGGSPDIRACVPPGYARADDGSVQQILASNNAFIVRSNSSINMDGTTDHPGLLVRLSMAEAQD